MANFEFCNMMSLSVEKQHEFVLCHDNTDEDQTRNANSDPRMLSLEMLSVDVLLAVFKFVDIKARFKLRLSKKLNEVFEKSMKSVKMYSSSKSCDIRCSSKSCEIRHESPCWCWHELIRILKYCPNMQNLDLKYFCSLNFPFSHEEKSEISQTLMHCPKIVSLDVTCVDLSPHSVASLGEFTQVQSLNLTHITLWSTMDIESGLHTAFSCLRNLKWLKLKKCRIQGLCLAAVNREKLEFLDISDCTFSSAGVEAFLSGEWPALRELIASSLRFDNGIALEFLELLTAKARNLVSLDISQSPLSEETNSLELLVTLEHFKHLRARRIANGNALVHYLRALASQPQHARQMETLDVSAHSITPDTILFICNLTGLKELHLISHYPQLGSEIQDAILKVCRSCSRVEKLTLYGFPNLSDAHLASIGHYCPLLTHFHFATSDETTINDGIKALVACLRSSGHKVKGRKLEITVDDGYKVDGDIWHYNDPLVTVNVSRFTFSL